MIFEDKRSQTGPGFYNGDGSLLSTFSLQVEQVGGTGATWTVTLDGSLDQVNWTPILTHTNTNPGNGLIESTGAGQFPCRFRRINVVSLSLGTATDIHIKTEGSV